MCRESEKTRIYLLGDSITQGLGSKKINFTSALQELLRESYEVINLAYTGTTISYALELVDQGKIITEGCSETRCIILYGNVDAQIRPNRKGKVFPHIPKRYQGGGMLMPRPFYSHSFYKRIGQHVDSFQRKFFASLIKLVDGTEQWVNIESFTRQYAELLDRLSTMRIKAIPCSCVYIDGRLFPGCPEQYRLYNGRIKSLADEGGLPYIDFFSLFDSCVTKSGWDAYYNKDHFHPNGNGYEIMAKEIANKIKY